MYIEKRVDSVSDYIILHVRENDAVLANYKQGKPLESSTSNINLCLLFTFFLWLIFWET